MSRAVAGALLATAAALGCAQPGSPPGGPEDRSPPRVVAVRPAPFDTLTDLDEPVLIRFDERISERLEGVPSFRDAVLVSPVGGEVKVDPGRSTLEIIPDGGWAPDQVYRVVVLPVFRDLFGNRRVEPIELVFSTGAPIPETAVAGFVEDRITGRRVPDARVEAVSQPDSVRFVAVTDTAGFFAIRFLRPGTYDVQAWMDQDRDAEPDFFEGQDTADAGVEAADTVVLELALLPRDTTPARLARAEPVDSTRVRLVFDDYFAVGPVAGNASVYLASDSSLVSNRGELIHATRLDSILAAEAAVRDSIRAEAARRDSIRAEAARRDSIRAEAARQDSIRAEAARQDSLERLGLDTLPVPDTVAVRDTAGVAAAAPPDTGGVAAPRRLPGDAAGRRPGQLGGTRPSSTSRRTGPPLPSQELILLLADPLVPDTAYYVEVEGVVNIRGVPGGGGTAPFRSLAPDTTARDTVPLAPDTLPLPPGTTVRDTVPLAPDTLVSDTTALPPDTGGAGARR